MTIPNSVIAGICDGKVFVDDVVEPRAALVYNNGACTLAGEAEGAFGEAACRWLMEFHGADYFILFAHPERWEPILDRLMGNAATKRRRLDFALNPSTFAAHEDWRSSIPRGFELRRMDETLMQQVRDEVLPYSKNYWRSARDFVRDGIGFCMIHESAIVSICYTCFAWRKHHDIDIWTSERHQRKGLAMAVACAFIEHCLNHGLTPDWDCWSKNQSSVSLATKLGFESRAEVVTYHGIQADKIPARAAAPHST